MADYYEIDDPSNYYPDLSGIGDISDPGNYYPDLSDVGDIGDPANYPRSSTNPGGYTTPTTTSGNWLSKLINTAKTAGGKALDFAGTDRGLMAILAALASYADRQRPSGGGVGTAYAGYKPLQRTMQGNIARYAAQGGIMHAYANGGKVQMEDGGFVMTKRAVDGAGGPRGIAQLVPGARMIGGPPDPTGKRDLTPAVINGPHGQTPARVSRGEAYVTPEDVEEQGGSQRMYALMNKLQRRA